MHLDHINLCSSDLKALAEQLAAHFGYRILDSRTFPEADGSGTSAFALVVGADGSELVITQVDPRLDGQSAYPQGFHFGLMQDTRDDVFAKHDELTAAGLNPGEVNDGFEVWGATWTAFYYPLGDGLEVEINYRTPSELLDAEPE